MIPLALDAGRFVWDPEWAIALVLVAIDYAYVVRVYGRRGVRVAVWRRCCFGAGLVIIALALFSPIEHLALTSMVSAHLLQNVMLGDWAPPLLVFGMAPEMASAIERRLPIRGAHLAWVALALWLAVWYCVHIPAYYDYALVHQWALGFEHLLFVLAGLMFWWPELTPGHLSYGQKVVYLFAAFVLISPLDLVLALSGTPLYHFYLHTPKLWGLSPVEDQQIGAVTMTIEQNVILFAACAAAFVKLLEHDAEAPEPIEAAS